MSQEMQSLLWHLKGVVVPLLHKILERIENMGTVLDTLTADVAAATTVEDSAITLLQGLKAQLDAAGTDPAALQALSASIESETAKLAAAVTANTPAAPPPAPTPAPTPDNPTP